MKTLAREGKHSVVDTGKDLALMYGDRYCLSYGTKGRTGMYWDELADSIDPNAGRILLLGCAGGTVARLLRERGSRQEIIGVENDRECLSLAKRYFDVEKYCSYVHFMDANAYLKDIKFPAFDAVVLDAYVHATKPAIIPIADIRRVLAGGGALFYNRFDSEIGRNSIERLD